MAKVARQHWQSDLASGLSRRDRMPCEYDAYLPDHLGGRPVYLEGDVAADVADAEAEIRRLNDGANALADTEALARLLLRAEAVASSRIEGLEVGGGRLLRAEFSTDMGDEARDVTATEVLGNIDAMRWATDTLAAAPTIDVDGICEIHRRLLTGTQHKHIAGIDQDRAELDRRKQLQPVFRRLRSPAAGRRRRAPQRPVRVHQSRRSAYGRASRVGTRPVRDDPPLRRRKRSNGPRPDPRRAPTARPGRPRRSTDLVDPCNRGDAVCRGVDGVPVPWRPGL